MCSEVVDKKQSILPCYSYNYSYILNNNGMVVIVLANNIRNFCCERHVHLCPILHGMNSMYRLVVESNRMDIVTMTIHDDACKPKTVSMCLNWKFTWQHSLDKEPGARHMIKHRGALLLQKLPSRLMFNKYSQ